MQVHAECNEDMIIRDRMQDNSMPYLQAKEERNLPLHTAHQDTHSRGFSQVTAS